VSVQARDSRSLCPRQETCVWVAPNTDAPWLGSKKLRSAERFLPDNINTAIENFRNAEWTAKRLGEDVKSRYADLKQASADRCPRLLGTVVESAEVQFHHEVYNQFLWNLF
jgi:glutamine synthetase